MSRRLHDRGEKEKLRPVVTAEPPTKADTWKGVATDADEQRIARLGIAWQEGLQEANKTSPKDVEAEGALLLPRAGLARPAPTPGSYNCRLIKLGRVEPKGPRSSDSSPSSATSRWRATS
ncbi:DUF4893 domain-containing protein (plasmid) [Sphingomonas daechungensis]|uniref:DUF4893 domain-containing protein n=1 Tax=Sphingomonas daechungensis TaxID=1176646 RepID=A0ABX6T5F6_9SPHN|nr:DUF4893 domain-containing protein [Sphingomonas daechungensis]QNP44639.1 DUF4893 domain-containing protein [Sphingomonas daechungensis]